MKRILTYTITKNDAGKTVLAFLKQKNYSHSVIVLLKKTEKGILVNDAWAYVSQALHTNDTLTVQLTEPARQPKYAAVELPVEILYEDSDLLVANKPANMPTHPSLDHGADTLANAIYFHAKSRQEYYPFRCVNRLDRDTSGLTVIAKNPYSSCILNEQMRKRMVHRTYYAIVSGELDLEGTIDAPIARIEESLVKRAVDFGKGKHAVTHYKRLFAQDGISFAELALDTGRTHQIRVHMSYIGHPLIGDSLYSSGCGAPALIKRQALHAGVLEFNHPVDGKPLRFCAPLPDDMLQFFPVRGTVIS